MGQKTLRKLFDTFVSLCSVKSVVVPQVMYLITIKLKKHRKNGGIRGQSDNSTRSSNNFVWNGDVYGRDNDWKR